MLEIEPITKIVSHDERISTVMTSLPPNKPIKIILNGKTGVLINEEAYNGLLETLRILQENPSIVQSLEERENGEFIDEGDIHNYV
jgi:PHD/YefM family antitoxin component YafN of YafNO toxin-antitoxin module